MARRLKCKVDTLNSFLKREGIEYRGNIGAKGKKISPLKKSAEELMSENKLITSYKLKNRILEESLKEYRCECCGLTEWNGKPIPLELHHINGDHYDNRFENLQLLCPNCHAQTDNYSCKKKK